MRDYRWALQYDRNVTSRVNPPVEDSECEDCGGRLDADGFCITESMDAAKFEEMAHGAERFDFEDYRHVLEPENF